jgi:hypothetical protein
MEKAALGDLEQAITTSHHSSQKRIVGQKEKIEKQRPLVKSPGKKAGSTTSD